MNLRPVSQKLADDVREQVRKHGLVVWLDRDGHYTGFVDGLAEAAGAGSLPYRVFGYRGSHLELMLALEGATSGVDAPLLLLHLPGFTQQSVRQTPALSLYRAGTQYQIALATLVSNAAAGEVEPERIAHFLGADAGGASLTLAGADAWLSAALAGGGEGDGDSHAVEVLLRAMTPRRVFDDLLGPAEESALRGQGREPTGGALAALQARLGAWLGLPSSWRELVGSAERATLDELAFAGASWALGVEFVHDLRGEPRSEALRPAQGLPRPVVEACRALASHLRERHPTFYQRTADETERYLSDDVSGADAEVLGDIDTFRFEESAVLSSALAALAEGRWGAAADWAELRLDPKRKAVCYWTHQDLMRQHAWRLVRGAARLGTALERAGERLGVAPTAGGDALERAVARYVAAGSAVDRAHRELEQDRWRLLHGPLPMLEVVRARLDELRTRWRRWADAWARDFNALCRGEGFVGGPGSQQRTLFDDLVVPSTKLPGATALFMVDALRFEMGAALFEHIAGTPATTAHLTARLAELPTITAVGMNALAPVARDGRLTPVVGAAGASGAGELRGFTSGTLQVARPDDRKAAMRERVGGKLAWLGVDEVLAAEARSLKGTVSQVQLVVVHSQRIDLAGESGVGTAVFEDELRALRSAWRLLREAGVRRFVITSDHGFLLLDEVGETAQAHGRKVDPKRRYVLSTAAADHAGEVRVPLASLGYDGAAVAGVQLMLPESAAAFDTGKGAGRFVHGGNSLQERVIPVLSVVHRAAAGASTTAYAVRATRREGVAGMACLEAEVVVAEQGALDFGGAPEVELAARAVAGGGAVEVVRVELCETRGGARLVGSSIFAKVGAPFEVFFRVLEAPVLAGGAVAARAEAAPERVRVELFHPSGGAQVEASGPPEWFAVASTGAVPTPKASEGEGTDEDGAGGAVEAAGTGPGVGPGDDWLGRLPDDGARAVFVHLARHGAVTELDVAALLGGPRQARRFARGFDGYEALAPFAVRIDVIGGVKRYVREGGKGREDDGGGA